MVVVGQIIHIGEEQQITENFKKAEVWLKTVEQYPNYYKVEYANGNIELIKNLEVGQNVKIHCNLSGRLYEAQDGTQDVFMSLRGWKVESA